MSNSNNSAWRLFDSLYGVEPLPDIVTGWTTPTRQHCRFLARLDAISDAETVRDNAHGTVWAFRKIELMRSDTTGRYDWRPVREGSRL